MNRQQVTALMLGVVFVVTLNVQASPGDILSWLWTASQEMGEQLYPDLSEAALNDNGPYS